MSYGSRPPAPPPSPVTPTHVDTISIDQGDSDISDDDATSTADFDPCYPAFDEQTLFLLEQLHHKLWKCYASLLILENLPPDVTNRINFHLSTLERADELLTEQLGLTAFSPDNTLGLEAAIEEWNLALSSYTYLIYVKTRDVLVINYLLELCKCHLIPFNIDSNSLTPGTYLINKISAGIEVIIISQAVPEDNNFLLVNFLKNPNNLPFVYPAFQLILNKLNYQYLEQASQLALYRLLKQINFFVFQAESSIQLTQNWLAKVENILEAQALTFKDNIPPTAQFLALLYFDAWQNENTHDDISCKLSKLVGDQQAGIVLDLIDVMSRIARQDPEYVESGLHPCASFLYQSLQLNLTKATQGQATTQQQRYGLFSNGDSACSWTLLIEENALRYLTNSSEDLTTDLSNFLTEATFFDSAVSALKSTLLRLNNKNLDKCLPYGLLLLLEKAHFFTLTTNSTIILSPDYIREIKSILKNDPLPTHQGVTRSAQFLALIYFDAWQNEKMRADIETKLNCLLGNSEVKTVINLLHTISELKRLSPLLTENSLDKTRDFIQKQNSQITIPLFSCSLNLYSAITNPQQDLDSKQVTEIRHRCLTL